MRVKKYIKGPVLTLIQAVHEINDGRYIFWGNRPVHPGWMGGVSVNTVRAQCAHSQLFYALTNPEWSKTNE